MEGTRNKCENVCLAAIMDYLGIDSLSDFADSLGTDISQIIIEIARGKRAMDESTALTIHDRYPDINYDWILTGNGNFKSEYYVIPMYSDFPQTAADKNKLFMENIVFPSELFGKPRYAVKVADENLAAIVGQDTVLLVADSAVDLVPGRNYYIELDEVRFVGTIDYDEDTRIITAMIGDDTIEFDRSDIIRMECICCMLSTFAPV